jgi:hypothetical protein
MPELRLDKGETREWNGQRVELKPILENSRPENIAQDFVINRVARFSPTQRAWLIHWLRTTATTAKNIKLTRDSLLAMVHCIEGAPRKGKPRKPPLLEIKSKWPGRCLLCEKRHAKGERIFWRAGEGAYCPECIEKLTGD